MLKNLRKYWVGMVAVFFILVSIFLSFVFPDWVQGWDVRLDLIASSTGWTLFFLQYFNSKSEKFYVLVNSLRLWLSNDATKWNFTVDLANCAKGRPLDAIWQLIDQRESRAILWHRDDDLLIVNMPGYTLRSFVVRESSHQNGNVIVPPTVCVQFSNLELPFKSFRTQIENEAIPLIRDISSALEPTAEKYVAKVSFSSNNPYFGFFVRRLDLPNVVSFSCDLIESTVSRREQMVYVRKDRIEIVTDDVLALQALSKKYVRLASS